MKRRLVLLVFGLIALMLWSCGAPTPPQKRVQQSSQREEIRKDTFLFVFQPNTSFIAGNEETVDLTNVKIHIAETYVKVNDIILNNVSYPRRRVISPTEEEWEITTILKSPTFFQALPKKVVVKVRKKGADILFIKFNDQVFTSKAYYSMNALPTVTSDTSTYHLVLYGENLGRISKKYNKSIEDLQKLNPGLRTNIQPGQRIKVDWLC